MCALNGNGNGKKADDAVECIIRIGRLGCGQNCYVSVDRTIQFILPKAGGTVVTSIA